MRTKRRLGIVVCAALALAVAVPASASAAPVTIKQLPAVPGGTSGNGSGVNERGVAVGHSNAAHSHAVRWETDGRVTDLAPVSGDAGAEAYAINDAGTVVGDSYDAKGQRAAMWTPAGKVKALATLPGTSYCEARAINASGQIAGSCSTTYAIYEGRAVRWTPDGDHVTDLGALPNGKLSNATGIGPDGTVVGWARDDREQRAVRWGPDGAVSPLATYRRAYYSRANGINASGAIVGAAQANVGNGDAVFAVRWNPDGTVTDLGGLKGAAQPDNEAKAINADGIAVGMSLRADGKYQPVRWNLDGTVTDLGILPSAGPGTITFASAINRAGLIIGSSGAKPVRWN